MRIIRDKIEYQFKGSDEMPEKFNEVLNVFNRKLRNVLLNINAETF